MTAEQVFEILPGFKERLDSELKQRTNNEWRDYERTKKLMAKHVGWLAYNPAAKTSEAYDSMIAYIVEQLGL